VSQYPVRHIGARQMFAAVSQRYPCGHAVSFAHAQLPVVVLHVKPVGHCDDAVHRQSPIESHVEDDEHCDALVHVYSQRRVEALHRPAPHTPGTAVQSITHAETSVKARQKYPDRHTDAEAVQSG